MNTAQKYCSLERYPIRCYLNAHPTKVPFKSYAYLVYAIYEQEEQRQRRDLERGLRLAQDVGLKVHLSFGRYGNLFAGPSLMPSWYTFRHPHSRVMDSHGRYHDASCFNHQPFLAWLFKEIEHCLTTYPINGIF